ncbi:CobW family GTP-binding protein [Vibrio maerlii]|uniref:CobW family GTP-binding protein n=1 Tax=Vibrio maerlii TaxID=2231648 RepID=UPI000E3E59DF|nr:GTP-binding protein [Vibrio maerlii]
MSGNDNKILGVPTNIITGFLGVGKTSAILNLMKNKPDNEKWAVLVNEFGEIGIDGALLDGQRDTKGSVFMREVPGGCMCCTAGLPMQIALNQLLTEAKPDRLLIEPTGLGHPKEVLQVLSSQHYQQVLSLQKTITLVDARKLADHRYTGHDVFNQQIAIADTVVGNKSDLYCSNEFEQLQQYVTTYGKPEARVLLSKNGIIAFEEFEGGSELDEHKGHHHHHERKPIASELPLPESGVLKAMNEGEGFQSVGWRFSASKVFDRNKLLTILMQIDAERMKAVFITYDGIFGYNMTPDGLTEAELDDCNESRIEVIGHEIDDDLELQLLNCIV